MLRVLAASKLPGITDRPIKYKGRHIEIERNIVAYVRILVEHWFLCSIAICRPLVLYKGPAFSDRTENRYGKPW